MIIIQTRKLQNFYILYDELKTYYIKSNRFYLPVKLTMRRFNSQLLVYWSCDRLQKYTTVSSLYVSMVFNGQHSCLPSRRYGFESRYSLSLISTKFEVCNKCPFQVMMADVPNLFIWSLHNNGKLYELRKHESLTANQPLTLLECS